MSTQTQHFNLVKIAGSDSPNVFNTAQSSNMDTIDTNLWELGYTEETITTTDTISGKTITWHIRKYYDGRLEADGEVTLTNLPITTSWVGGWYRSNASINWVFPYVLTETPKEPFVRVISSSDLTTNTAPMRTSTISTSAYRSVMYLAAPDSKTCSAVKFGCQLRGRWSNGS